MAENRIFKSTASPRRARAHKNGLRAYGRGVLARCRPSVSPRRSIPSMAQTAKRRDAASGCQQARGTANA